MSSFQEVFLTKPEYAYDDHFIAPMMSVELHRATTADANGRKIVTAVPCARQSEWVMCAFPRSMDIRYSTGGGLEDLSKQLQPYSTIKRNLWSMKVGDTVRIGNAQSVGFSDYMQVLERVVCDEIKKGPFASFQIGITSAGEVISNTGAYQVSSFFEEGFVALRLNHSIDATTLPSGLVIDPTGARTPVTYANRGELFSFLGNNMDTPLASQYFYPMYRHDETPMRDLSLELRPDLGLVSRIRLVGYKIVHKPSVGVQHQHEAHDPDWYALRFLEQSGTVQSNDANADGAVHILHAGTGHDRAKGTVELVQYDPVGLAEVVFTPRNMSKLSVVLTDRRGQPARVGRVHIWLRIYREPALTRAIGCK